MTIMIRFVTGSPRASQPRPPPAPTPEPCPERASLGRETVPHPGQCGGRCGGRPTDETREQRLTLSSEKEAERQVVESDRITARSGAESVESGQRRKISGLVP